MKIYLKDEDQWKLYEGESLKDALVKRKINIGRGVQIGSYVRIGSYVQIDSDVRIGSYVRIDSGVQIDSDVRIGSYVRIDSGVRIGSDVRIGSYVQIDSDVRIGRGVQIGSDVRIDSDVRIGSYVQIDSDVRIGRGVQIGRGVLKINSLGREPYRQFSQSMQWHPKRGLLIQAGCRIFNISQAREHWSAAQYENREIGDYYLRLIDYIETEAKALGWVKITEMIQEPQK